MKASLAAEEQTRLQEVQDLPIDRFVAHERAIDNGTAHRARELQREIDDLLREKRDIRVVGGCWVGVALIDISIPQQPPVNAGGLHGKKTDRSCAGTGRSAVAGGSAAPKNSEKQFPDWTSGEQPNCSSK